MKVLSIRNILVRVTTGALIAIFFLWCIPSYDLCTINYWYQVVIPPLRYFEISVPNSPLKYQSQKACTLKNNCANLLFTRQRLVT